MLKAAASQPEALARAGCNPSLTLRVNKITAYPRRDSCDAERRTFKGIPKREFELVLLLKWYIAILLMAIRTISADASKRL